VWGYLKKTRNADFETWAGVLNLYIRAESHFTKNKKLVA
jgi:hypothetical protein